MQTVLFVTLSTFVTKKNDLAGIGHALTNYHVLCIAHHFCCHWETSWSFIFFMRFSSVCKPHAETAFLFFLSLHKPFPFNSHLPRTLATTLPTPPTPTRNLKTYWTSLGFQQSSFFVCKPNPKLQEKSLMETQLGGAPYFLMPSTLQPPVCFPPRASSAEGKVSLEQLVFAVAGLRGPLLLMEEKQILIEIQATLTIHDESCNNGSHPAAFLFSFFLPL